jgi:hypothetical protein
MDPQTYGFLLNVRILLLPELDLMTISQLLPVFLAVAWKRRLCTSAQNAKWLVDLEGLA